MIHGDVLGERARLTPAAPALVEVATGRRFTYRELDQRAVACARLWLESLGLSPGDRVGVLSGNRVEFLDAFFAAGKSGVILVPLSTRATAHELAGIVADCGLAACLYDGEHAGVVAELRRAASVPRWVAFDTPQTPGDPRYAELIGELSPSDWRRNPCDPESPYCLLYTSGTTGKPKGVIIPHRMVAWNGLDTVIGWQLRADDVSPIFTPLYHAGGLGAFLVPIFTIGGTIVLHARFDVSEVWRTIERERCTVVLGVPTIWKILADAPEFHAVDLSAVRWFASGGAPLPKHLVEVYAERGVVLRQGYGLTEVGVNCFAMTDENARLKAGSIGTPMMFTDARVVDADNRPLPSGEVGELVFRGPHVSAGYWNNPQATAASRDADGWFHTGDMARFDEDGYFTIAGRGKDMFISGGVNVYPAEVENELLQHPGLADAAVIGVPDETWGEVGVAFVVAAEGATVDATELSGFVAARLAKYKVPRRFVTVDALPRTPYGKVIKAELAERWQELIENGEARDGGSR